MVTFIDEWRQKFPSCMVVKGLREKNIKPIFGKINEGDEMKTLDKFLEKLMRVTE